jgi:hypothetical protein
VLRLRSFTESLLYDAFIIATVEMEDEKSDETEPNEPRRHDAKCSQDSDLNVIHFRLSILVIVAVFVDVNINVENKITPGIAGILKREATRNLLLLPATGVFLFLLFKDSKLYIMTGITSIAITTEWRTHKKMVKCFRVNDFP